MMENLAETTADVMVVCEQKDARFEKINHELLGKARSLVEKTDAAVVCVAVGSSGSEEDLYSLFRYGAQRVFYNSMEGHHNYWMVAKLIHAAIRKCNPKLAMFPGFGMYKMAASTVAFLTGSGLTADCIDIVKSEQWDFIFTRAAMNASIIAGIICQHSMVRLCTVKQNVFHKFIRTYEAGEGESELLPLKQEDIYQAAIEFIERQCAKVQQNDNLQRAKVVIAVGRGVDTSDYAHVQDIAGMLHAEIGCTRSVVEEGWLPKSRQIGQSGIMVSPKLYLALGISGASQHIVGMHGSNSIVAVNRNRNAPIFECCDMAIVNDCHVIIMGLKEILLKKYRGDA